MLELLQSFKTAAWLVGVPILLGLIGHFFSLKRYEKLSSAPEASSMIHWSDAATDALL